MAARIPFTLAHPIATISREADGTERSTTITELSLAPRVKGRHMKATDPARGPLEAKLLLISSLAGITRAEADELDQVDVMAIDALYDEESDLTQIASELGLPPGSGTAAIRQAIRQLRASEGLRVPLDGGAGSPADGRATGATSSAT
jgi:hypothetical protein